MGTALSHGRVPRRLGRVRRRDGAVRRGAGWWTRGRRERRDDVGRVVVARKLVAGRRVVGAAAPRAAWCPRVPGAVAARRVRSSRDRRPAPGRRDADTTPSCRTLLDRRGERPSAPPRGAARRTGPASATMVGVTEPYAHSRGPPPPSTPSSPGRWRSPDGRAAETAGDPALVGDHLGASAEPVDASIDVVAPTRSGRVVTHTFASRLPGYVGWHWAVTLARVPGEDQVTVDEVVLLPGDQALLAPAWVPWHERLRPGDLSVGDVLPCTEDDHRLAPSYAVEDDSATDPEGSVVASELGLGRERVMSRRGPRGGPRALVRRRVRPEHRDGPPRARPVRDLRVLPAAGRVAALRRSVRAATPTPPPTAASSPRTTAAARTARPRWCSASPPRSCGRRATTPAASTS